MRVAALCFIALLAVASATSLDDIHEHPLGRTLMLSVATSVEAGQSTDDVSSFLAGLLKNAEHYSFRLDEDFKAEKGGLDIDIRAEKKLINELRAIIQTLTNTIRVKTETLERKQDTYAQTVKQLALTRRELENVEKEHARIAPLLKKDVEASIEAHAATKEAIAHMETYQAAIGSSLLQTATETESKLQAFSKKLEELKPTLTKKNVQTSIVVHELISLTANPKQSKTERVLSLLRQLEKTVGEEVINSKAERANEQRVYEENVIRLKNEIQRLYHTKVTLEQEIEVLKKQIAAAKAELIIQNQNLKDAEETLKVLEARLEAVIAAYKHNRAKTDSELSIFKALIHHFETSVQDVSAYAKNAAKTGKGTF